MRDDVRRRRLRRAGLSVATLVSLGLLTVSATISAGQSAPAVQGHAPAIPGMRLIFDDEFNGPAGARPNPANWIEQTGGNGWGSNELETYTTSVANARLDGAGHLQIIARRQRATGTDGITRDYTSARLVVAPIQFTYGVAEVRAKLPTGLGVWSLFWALGDNPDGVGLPLTGEFDILEVINPHPITQRASVHGAVVSSGEGSPVVGKWKKTAGYPLKNPGAWHVYAVHTSPGRLAFSVDGHPYFTFTKADLKPGEIWPFDAPFYLILNLAVGGYSGNPAATDFPQTMVVDWVRVYAPDNDVSS